METGKKYYSEYDYEEEYQKQIEKLSEWEIKNIIRQKKLGFIYVTKTTKAGEQIGIDIYPAFGSRHDLPRAKKKKPSRQTQKNLNERRSKRRLTELINVNFGKNDIWATLTYDERHLPGSIEEAQKNFSRFIRRLNRMRKKKGLPNIKYIVVTEWSEGDKGIRAHHHAMLQGDMSMDEIESAWRYGKRNNLRRADPDEYGLTGIAEYISKDPKGKKRWSSSRNLKKPKVTRAFGKYSRYRVERMVMDRGYLMEQIERSYPGTTFLDASIRVNEMNGGFYVYVRLKKIE